MKIIAMTASVIAGLVLLGMLLFLKPAGDIRMQSFHEASVVIKPYKNLPSVDIGWLTLKDHFIATVGPYSGTGRPLKNLLVLADAKIHPQSSFPKHPHEDMEILTWVVKGTLHHQDSKGSDQFVPELSLQLMSARDGIFHAEGNSTSESLRILQIWINPLIKGGAPVVSTAALDQSGFKLMAAPEKAPLIIRQELWLYAAKIQKRESFEVPPEKFGYALFMGDLELNGQSLKDGDGAILNPGSYAVEGSGQVILILQNK